MSYIRCFACRQLVADLKEHKPHCKRLRECPDCRYLVTNMAAHRLVCRRRRNKPAVLRKRPVSMQPKEQRNPPQ